MYNKNGIQTKAVKDSTGRVIGTVKVYEGTIKKVQEAQKGKKRGIKAVIFVLVAALGLGGYLLYDALFGKKDTPTVLPQEPGILNPVDLSQYNVPGLEAFVRDNYDFTSMVPVEYTFKKGDTLWGIASRVYDDKDSRNAFIEQIKEENDITNPKYIRDGRVLTMTVPEERLGRLNMTEGYSSLEEEHYSLQCYIRDNEWCVNYLEPTAENQALVAEYRSLRSQVTQLELDYSSEQDPVKRDEIMQKIVAADRLLLGFVEHYAQEAYVPGVVENTEGVKTM